MDSRLSFNVHTQKKIQQAQSTRDILKPLLKVNNELNIHLKLRLYRILIRSIFPYGAPIFNITGKKNRKYVQWKQNQILPHIRTRIYDTITLHNIYITQPAQPASMKIHSENHEGHFNKKQHQYNLQPIPNFILLEDT